MRIFVCERDVATADLIRRDLEACGHEVGLATDEAESLRKVKGECCEFVILDGTGIGLAPLRALRAAPWSADVPCVVLTASPEDSAIFDAYHRGADMVLTKPFNPLEIVAFRLRD